MATTANKNCKQFTGVVYETITAREGNVPGKGIVQLYTVEYNESGDEDNIVASDSTPIEVFNRIGMEYVAGTEVDIWQDGYGVYWVDDIIPDLEGWAEESITGFTPSAEYQIKLARGIEWEGEPTIDAGSSLLNFNSTIETGTPVLCRWFPTMQKWIVIEAACEPDPDYTPSSGGSNV